MKWIGRALVLLDIGFAVANLIVGDYNQAWGYLAVAFLLFLVTERR